MSLRLFTSALAVAGAALVIGASVAWGASDLYGNVGPGGSLSGLADRYPLGHYALDQHFSAVTASLTGGIDASGVPAMLAYFLANLIWQITAFSANALITIFAFAFSLDLLNGSPATGGAGALAPISDAIRNLYAHTFGQPWMVVAVTLAGCWAMWHALVQRRYTETASALAMSLVFCLIALAIVTRPDDTIGHASRLTNQLSTTFLSVTANGQITEGNDARRAASDQLFAVLIYDPWVALNFGGTEHCIRTGTGDQNHDPESAPVHPINADPAGDARLRHQLRTTGQITTAQKTCVSNTLRYPSHFLPYAPGSDDRDAEYQALNHADPSRLPDSDPAKANGTYRPGVVDKPVTDAMEKGGQDQRLLLALVVVVCELGALLLLGSLAVSVLLAQVVVLMLACFAPVALVAGIMPGRGHDAFKAWSGLLASYLVRKAAYSLVLAVLLAVLAALQDATTNLGWLMSFALQALLLWTVYLQRHTLAARLTSTITGHHPGRDAQLRRMLRMRTLSMSVPHARRPKPTVAPPTPAHSTPGLIEHRHITDSDASPDSHADPAHRAEPTPEPNRDRPPRRPARDHPLDDPPRPPVPQRPDPAARTTEPEPRHTQPSETAATARSADESIRPRARRSRAPRTPATPPSPTARPAGPDPEPPVLDSERLGLTKRTVARHQAGQQSEPSLADQLERDRARLRQSDRQKQGDAHPRAADDDGAAASDEPEAGR